MLDFMSKRSANTVTLINIVFGSLSLIHTLHGNHKAAALCILLAVVMDGMDGRIARKFGVSSEMGKELDSLCDLVSFGVAPALLLYAQVMYIFPHILGLIVAILYIVCGAFRLARFNVLNIKEYFIGMPITLAGTILAFVSLLAASIPVNLILITVVFLAYMMISNIKVPKY
ncbi:MAG: CDP-diacylglycerol--serine O-phosphatidyltransferase [Syntrophomonadaceae bacterium]|nr:CDP-diacylglycerol--serine O-phosphatidyltransferase [Syntrophomonadaceae bacterium]